MGIWDDSIKSALPGFLGVLATVAAAPIVLPALARIARPLAKAAIRLSFEVADDIREVVAHHQPRPRPSPGLVHDLLRGGTEDLVTAGLGVEAEGSALESAVAVVAEIL